MTTQAQTYPDGTVVEDQDTGQLFVYQDGQPYPIPPQPDNYFGPWPPVRTETFLGLPRAVIDWDALNKLANQAQPQEQSRDTLTSDEADAFVAANPQYEKVLSGFENGIPVYSVVPIQPNEKVLQTPDAAVAYGKSRGMQNPQAQWNGYGWVPRPGEEVNGQLYDNFQSARQNTPPGFQAVQLSNGMWGFERLPETPEQRFRDFDDLVLQTYVKQGTQAALRIDSFRDMIESNQPISMLEALNFGFTAATVSGEFDPIAFREVVDIVRGMVPTQQQDPFASAAMQSSAQFESIVNGTPAPPPNFSGIRGPAGGVPTTGFVNSIVARGIAQDAVDAQGPFDTPDEEAKFFDDVFQQELDRLEEAQANAPQPVFNQPDAFSRSGIPTLDPLTGRNLRDPEAPREASIITDASTGTQTVFSQVPGESTARRVSQDEQGNIFRQTINASMAASIAGTPDWLEERRLMHEQNIRGIQTRENQQRAAQGLEPIKSSVLQPARDPFAEVERAATESRRRTARKRAADSAVATTVRPV